MNPGLSLSRPLQLGGDRRPIGHSAGGDKRTSLVRLVDTGRIFRHVVAARAVGPGTTPTTNRSVFTAAALSTERSLAQLTEHFRVVPHLGERRLAEIAGRERHIRTRRELAVWCYAPVLHAARAASGIIENRRLRSALVHQSHEVRCTLGSHHHSPHVLDVKVHEIAQRILVFLGRQLRHLGAAPRGNHEIRVERHGAPLGRPRNQFGQLATVPPRERGLYDEIETVHHQPVHCSQRRLERTVAAPEAVVILHVERLDTHRNTGHAGVL